MGSEILFTIAIPVYNGEKSLSRAIESVLNQDYDSDYEVLIVNNASTDHTEDIIEKFHDSKIKVVNNKETVSQFCNHNICLKNARGKYILFCHADDELYTIALSVLDKELKRLNYPTRFIIWGHSLFRDFSWALQQAHLPVNQVFSGEAAYDAFAFGGLTPSGTCYSRKSLLEIGGFPLQKNRLQPCDWSILWKTAFSGFEYEMIDRLIFKRVDATTASRNVSFSDTLEANRECMRELFKTLNERQIEIVKSTIGRMNPNYSFPLFKEYIQKRIRVRFYISSFIRHPRAWRKTIELIKC